jgi:hypothetical protein
MEALLQQNSAMIHKFLCKPSMLLSTVHPPRQQIYKIYIYWYTYIFIHINDNFHGQLMFKNPHSQDVQLDCPKSTFLAPFEGPHKPPKGNAGLATCLLAVLLQRMLSIKTYSGLWYELRDKYIYICMNIYEYIYMCVCVLYVYIMHVYYIWQLSMCGATFMLRHPNIPFPRSSFVQNHTSKMFNWTAQDLNFWLHLGSPINPPGKCWNREPACSRRSCSRWFQKIGFDDIDMNWDTYGCTAIYIYNRWHVCTL